jgi:hypothetical protein
VTQPEAEPPQTLNGVIAGLDVLCGLLVEIGELRPVDQVPLGDVAEARGEALEYLSRLATLGHRQLAEAAERLPEQVLVERLRALGVTWTAIASVTDLNSTALFKRYRSVS